MNAPLASGAGRRYLEALHTFAASAFRLETRQSYGGSGEDAAYAAFQAGGPRPPLDGDDLTYLSDVRAARARGARWQRVHVVREPLSAYLRFELTWKYGPNVEAGEEIGLVVLGETEPWPAELPREVDFWLFDEGLLFELSYDPDGMWLSVNEIADRRRVEQAQRWRSAALRRARDWQGYVARASRVRTPPPRLREVS